MSEVFKIIKANESRPMTEDFYMLHLTYGERVTLKIAEETGNLKDLERFWKEWDRQHTGFRHSRERFLHWFTLNHSPETVGTRDCSLMWEGWLARDRTD